jgi:site-specific DNA-methyltransferase (adenine-specific)
MSDRLTILTGDARKTLCGLPGDSIPLVVTSPPYDDLRTYGGVEWTWGAFIDIATELYRVIKPGGILCWVVNDATKDGSETVTSCKQKIYFREACGFCVHDTMIYAKSNGSKPNPRRYNQVFEYIFVLSKGRPVTVNLIRDKPNVTAGKSVFGKHTIRQKDGSMRVRKPRLIAAAFGVRGNVWHGNTRGQEDVCRALPHPAMMPKWLARDLILSFSNVGDTVLDPFGGSGTTAQQALESGRSAIICEVNPDYVPLIHQSCTTTIGFL